jgi:hypothetical protein
MEDEDAVGSACFGPRIRDEPFPKGFSLPRDTPKYNSTMKPEDWLTDYATTVDIAGDNKHVAVRYVLLMLLGSARTWLNSLKANSINSWLDFSEVFVHNFNITYNWPPKPRQLSMCVQGPNESTRDYLTCWTELRKSCEGWTRCKPSNTSPLGVERAPCSSTSFCATSWLPWTSFWLWRTSTPWPTPP